MALKHLAPAVWTDKNADTKAVDALLSCVDAARRP